VIIIKIKTKNQTYEITDIRKQTTTYFEAYYNDYLIIIEKEAKWYQIKEKTVKIYQNRKEDMYEHMAQQEI